MAKVRIHEIAKELGYDSKDIIQKANELGLDIKTASNAVEPEVAAGIYEYIQTKTIPAIFKKEEKKTGKNLKKEEKPKAVKAKKETKKEEPKEEIQEKVEPLKEEAKEEIKEEKNEPQSLAGATLAKRRGLVIVKKKKDEQEFKKEEQKPSTSERPSLSMIFSNAD
uniref:translation initiation factor IF-2 N-terminal domain-containing protein n=1 Tax=Campylobacter upsaliensis TaxID=28080 RepID=UPI0022EB532F